MVQGFKGSRIQGFKDSRIQGLSDSGTHGFELSCIPRFTDDAVYAWVNHNKKSEFTK